MRTTFNPLGMASDMKYPDYSNPITINYSTSEINIPENGILYCITSLTANANIDYYIYLNNTSFFMGRMSTNEQWVETSCIPLMVKKNDKFRVSNNAMLKQCTLFPFN